MHRSLVFSRSGVCSINCWTIQKGKILRFKRGFWANRSFPSGTSFWSRNYGNLDVGCATENSGKGWKLPTQDLNYLKKENNGSVKTAIWNYSVFPDTTHPHVCVFIRKWLFLYPVFGLLSENDKRCSAKTNIMKFRECSPKIFFFSIPLNRSLWTEQRTVAVPKQLKICMFFYEKYSFSFGWTEKTTLTGT